MAIQPIKSQTILDVFGRQSKLDKEMEQARLANILAGYNNTIKGVEAQYAPQMSQEELRKAQLFNMIQQAKAKYAEQNERASLQDILAGTNVKNQTARNWELHNQYLPREKEAAIQMSEMKNKNYPLEMEDERRKNLSEYLKKIQETNKLKNENIEFPNKMKREQEKNQSIVDKNLASKSLSELKSAEQKIKNEFVRRQQIAQTLIGENQAQYAQPMSETALQGNKLRNQGQQISNQYAPQIAQGNIEGTRLGNEGKMIANRAAPQMNEANLQGKQLGNQLTEQEIKKATINNEYARKEKELEMEMSQAKAKYEKFKAENAPKELANETMKAESYAKANSSVNLNKKNAPKVAQIQTQLNELKKTHIDPINGEKLSGRALEDQINNYRMALDDAVVSPDDKRFLGTVGMNMDLFSEINKRQIAQNYGVFAKIKMGAKNVAKPLGYNDEVLNRFDQFLHQIAPTAAEGMRYAFKGSIQPSNLKKWYNQVVPNAWNNPESAYSRIVQFEKQMHDETRSRLKNVPRDGYYRQVRFENYHLIPGDIVPKNADELVNVARKIGLARGLNNAK